MRKECSQHYRCDYSTVLQSQFGFSSFFSPSIKNMLEKAITTTGADLLESEALLRFLIVFFLSLQVAKKSYMLISYQVRFQRILFFIPQIQKIYSYKQCCSDCKFNKSNRRCNANKLHHFSQQLPNSKSIIGT